MSIATCGHEVYEGISCSISESENEWSFGTYCVDCLKLYHAEGVLVDNEAKKLCDELAQQKALLDKYKKALGVAMIALDYYGNRMGSGGTARGAKIGINHILSKEEKQSYQFKADGKTLDT